MKKFDGMSPMRLGITLCINDGGDTGKMSANSINVGQQRMNFWAAAGYVVLRPDLGNRSPQTHPEYLYQRRMMLQFARRKSLKLRHVAYDWRSSLGGGLASRAGLVKSVAYTRNMHAQALLIYSLDTLQFTDLEAAQLMLAFSEWSVQVWEVITNSNLTSQVDRWKKITASADATSLSEVHRALNEIKKQATRFSQGTRVGRKPFGKHDGEQKILERIWKLRRKQRDGTGRLSYGAIAKCLNEEGEKPRQGKKWFAKTVQGIVKRMKPHLDRE